MPLFLRIEIDNRMQISETYPGNHTFQFDNFFLSFPKIFSEWLIIFILVTENKTYWTHNKKDATLFTLTRW